MMKIKSKDQSIQVFAITILTGIVLIVFFSLDQLDFKSQITPIAEKKEPEIKESLNRKLRNEISIYKSDIEKYSQGMLITDLLPTQALKSNINPIGNNEIKKKVQPILKLEAVIFGQEFGVAIIDGVAVEEGTVLKTGEILKRVSQESVMLTDKKGKKIRTIKLESLKSENNYIINLKE